ncbi:MAG: C25 family cysteine peptidase, partial [bacterium]
MQREVLTLFIVGSALLGVDARPLRGEKIWSSEVVSADELVVQWDGVQWAEERAFDDPDIGEEMATTSWVLVPPGVIPQVEVEEWQGREWGWDAVQSLFSSMPLSDTYFPEGADLGELELIFPPQPVVVGTPLYFRGYYLAPITVSPISFDPQRRKIKVTERIRARIGMTDDPYPHQRPIDPPGSDVSRFIDRITLNPLRRDPAEQMDHLGRILILYSQNLPQQARVWIDSLAVWKRQLGYRVDLLPADPQGDMISLRGSIRQNYWRVEEPISYLILIGSNQPQDAIYWPFFRQGAYEGDHFWGLMQDTNRFVTDVAVGRLLAASITELQGVIKRTILYEREP